MAAGWGRVGVFCRAGHRAQQAAHTASCIAQAITEKKIVSIDLYFLFLQCNALNKCKKWYGKVRKGEER